MSKLEMLARLNPKTIRYDVGRGGGFDRLSDQDVAATLAFVPRGLGRELLMRVYWPGGAELVARQFDEILQRLMAEELGKRSHAFVDADIAHMLAQASLQSAGPAHRRDAERHARQCELKREEARKACWPLQADTHSSLRTAVLREVSEPHLCSECDGRGAKVIENRLHNCTACRGTGRGKISDRERAKRIGRDESVFRRVWRDPYLWLLDRLESELMEAERQFCNAMRQDAEDAA
jgi:hypothetical protein